MSNNKRRFWLVLLVTASVLSGHKLMAREELGLFRFDSSLSISRTSDDNLFAEPHQVTEDRLTRYIPKLGFYGRKGKNSYSVIYEGDYAEHDHNPLDDYDDHAFFMDMKFDGEMNDLDVSVTYAKLHDKRGDRLSEGPLLYSRTRYDQFDFRRARGIWELGADSPVGLQLSADRSYIEYTNNLFLTQYYSREEDNYGVRTYVNLGSSVRIFLEQSRKNINYYYDLIPGVMTLDNKEDGYFAGFEWFYADSFSGVIKGGEVQKDFKYVDGIMPSSFEQHDLSSWDVEINYQPAPGSTFTLVSNRFHEERRTMDTFAIVRENSIRWEHQLAPGLTMTLSLLRGTDVLPNIIRVDERKEAGIKFELDRYKHVILGFGYEYQDSESNYDLFDFDRETFYFEIRVH